MADDKKPPIFNIGPSINTLNQQGGNNTINIGKPARTLNSPFGLGPNWG